MEKKNKLQREERKYDTSLVLYMNKNKQTWSLQMQSTQFVSRKDFYIYIFTDLIFHHL